LQPGENKVLANPTKGFLLKKQKIRHILGKKSKFRQCVFEGH
jgi:hypothetical protein